MSFRYDSNTNLKTVFAPVASFAFAGGQSANCLYNNEKSCGKVAYQGTCPWNNTK